MVEADESDRSFLKLAPRRGGDHQHRAGPPRDLRASGRAERGVRGVRRRGRRTPVVGPGRRSHAATAVDARRRRRRPSASRVDGADVELPVPGEHNVLNALAALAALRAAGRAADGGRAGARELHRHRPPLRAARARPRRRARSSTTTPTTRPRCAPRSRPRARSSRGGSSPLPAAPLLAHAAARARVRRARSRWRTVVVVVDIYPARERAEDFPGVTGYLVAAAAARRRRRAAGLVAAVDGRRRAAARARAARGRRAAHARRRQRRLARPTRLGAHEHRPQGVRARLPARAADDVRTGGPADWFARAGTSTRWSSCSRWADAEGIEVGVVGSGSNLLISDSGFRGLVLKLDEDLATIEQEGERLLCGGGARLPQAAAQCRARRPVGPRVRREHPRHRRRRGEDERERLRRRPRRACSSGWTSRRRTAPSAATPAELGFEYRRSNLEPARGRRARVVRARARGARPR